MPEGKPAGIACIHLEETMACRIFDDPRRPEVCTAFTPEPSVCGDGQEQALELIQSLEVASLPAGGVS